MGRREVHVVIVPRRASVLLLLLVSGGMIALLFYLSGKAYATGTHPAIQLMGRALRGGEPMSRHALLAALMPVVANILFFVPWGFLAFMVLDSPGRPRRTTYGLTLLAGLLFAAGMEVWQLFLPTRVISPADTLSNALGALFGAIGAHLRKEVRVQFQF